MGSTLATAMLRGFITNRRLWIASHLVMAFGVALPIIGPGIVPIMLAALFVGGTFHGDHDGRHAGARSVAGARATG